MKNRGIETDIERRRREWFEAITFKDLGHESLGMPKRKKKKKKK
jgi:hypothetical protein